MKYLWIAVFCLGLSPVLAGIALALEPSSCDPQVMDAMESKAWLHGQRRVAQNASLIFKPDSVLEYSCFDQLLAKVAIGDGAEFSEITGYPKWGAISSSNGTSLDIAIVRTSFMPLIDYLDANFRHTYLGGRTEADTSPPPVYGNYNCDAMSYVWKLARCMNFMDDQGPNATAYDNFYDFPTYALGDPRKFPPELPTCAQPTNINVSINEAYNGDQDYYTLDPENPLTFNSADTVLYEYDPIETRLLQMLPGNCTDSALVPTGVVVERRDLAGTPYNEFFCTMPACSYDYSGNRCVQ